MQYVYVYMYYMNVTHVNFLIVENIKLGFYYLMAEMSVNITVI